MNNNLKNRLSLKEIKSIKYGKLIVLKEVKRPKSVRNKKKHLRFFLCQCDCGNQVVVQLCAFRYYRTGRGGTGSCGCSTRRRGIENPNWKGYGRISGWLMGHIKTGAVSRSLKFSISAKFLDKLFDKQNGKCALSGVDLIIPQHYSRDLKISTASIDRIDSSKGYIPNNVQWIHKRLNIMKNNLSDEEFINFCKQVVEYQQLKSSIL